MMRVCRATPVASFRWAMALGLGAVAPQAVIGQATPVATTHTLIVRVVDSQTGAPIAGARVTAPDGNGHGQMTDSLGEAIVLASPQRFSVLVERDGYHTHAAQASVRVQGDTVIVALRPVTLADITQTDARLPVGDPVTSPADVAMILDALARSVDSLSRPGQLRVIPGASASASANAAALDRALHDRSVPSVVQYDSSRDAQTLEIHSIGRVRDSAFVQLVFATCAAPHSSASVVRYALVGGPSRWAVVSRQLILKARGDC
ncbi:MAG TPA: carboxypeptidase-like regulatory domain-containing protein [Steroidobacteraceae bacterium]